MTQIYEVTLDAMSPAELPEVTAHWKVAFELTGETAWGGGAVVKYFGTFDSLGMFLVDVYCYDAEDASSILFNFASEVK